jgi:hypothetical protein
MCRRSLVFRDALSILKNPPMNASLPYFTRSIGIVAACLSAGLATACNYTGDKRGATKPGEIIHHMDNSHTEPLEIPPACSPAWNQLVDSRLGISDGSGHGPDVGSDEWMGAVGRKSGVIDEAGHGPDPGSAEWCRAVDIKVFGRR